MLDKFEKIRQKYVGTFAHKQSEIQTAWVNKDIAHVHELMHKLAGSSGGYGFDELSLLAQKGIKLTYNDQLSNVDAMQQCLDKIGIILTDAYESQNAKNEV
ncbi:MAG: Hpt domain-containing protein [Marinicellaceae bacterium]